jgi:hypothetical protein
LTITTRAPASFAVGTAPATGYTCRVLPTARSRSASAAARSARSITSGTRAWPKEMVALFRIPPQARQGGSSSPARTRSSASCIGPRAPQLMHTTFLIVPCTSITRSGELPAAWCSSSMFWVTRACSLPRRSRAASASCPRLGRAFQAL